MGDVTPEFSVVLPAHNEADSIAPMCAALDAELAPLGSYEIIFVDDGSTDEHAGRNPRRGGAPNRPCAISRSPAISAISRRCGRACAMRAARRSS